ncbi:MAG: YtxH domain-containing protein [Actinobacteria bacterium]|nr:MAG: YtxH domain-containing protein [Actinomycetota bacterium]
MWYHRSYARLSRARAFRVHKRVWPGGTSAGRDHLRRPASITEVLTMYDYGRRSGGGVLGAFLLGGIIGAVLGLLFAPRSGKETREVIAAKADEYWGEGVEMYNTGKEKAAEYYEKGVETASESAEQMREKIDSARTRLQEQVAKTSSAAKDKVVEYAPVAKDAVSKAAETTKKGVDSAHGATVKAIDSVAEKAKVEEAAAEAPADSGAGTMDALPEI